MGTPIIDDLKDAINVMMHPTNYGYKTMSLGEGLVKYYKVMIIPMILAIILSVIFASAVGASAGALGAIGGGLFGGLLAVTEFLNYIILIPIGIIVSAFLLQLIAGNVLKWFKGGYSATLTAAIFSIFPVLIIGWISLLPIIGQILYLIALIWGFIVEIFALAKLHNISAGKAFAGVIVSGIIWGIIIFIILLIVGAAFLGAILGGLHLSAAPYAINTT